MQLYNLGIFNCINKIQMFFIDLFYAEENHDLQKKNQLSLSNISSNSALPLI